MLQKIHFIYDVKNISHKFLPSQTATLIKISCQILFSYKKNGMEWEIGPIPLPMKCMFLGRISVIEGESQPSTLTDQILLCPLLYRYGFS